MFEYTCKVPGHSKLEGAPGKEPDLELTIIFDHTVSPLTGNMFFGVCGVIHKGENIGHLIDPQLILEPLDALIDIVKSGKLPDGRKITQDLLLAHDLQEAARRDTSRMWHEFLAVDRALARNHPEQFLAAAKAEAMRNGMDIARAEKRAQEVIDKMRGKA